MGSHCARPTRGVRDRALRKHRKPAGTHIPSPLKFLPHPLGESPDCPSLHATFSPAHPLARRDVPLTRARGVCDRALREQRRSSGSIPSFILRARRAPGRSPPSFRDRALQEQRRPSSLPSSHTPSTLARFSREGDLFGLPLRAAFSPSHPLARRDVPLARARAF